MKHVGLSTHRFKENPKEKAFAEAWQKENDSGKVLEYLLSGPSNRPVPPTDRDVQVAATVIQWLGSPVGQNFLADVMFGPAFKQGENFVALLNNRINTKK